MVIEMRAIFTGTGFLLAAALAACNPYDPNLPPTPFRCGSGDPACPSGYECDGTLCVEATDGPDADTHADAGCQDLAEPNDTLTMATNGAVFDQLDHIMLVPLSLCPMMDTDFFHLNQPTNCGGAGPACPNLDVLAEFNDLGTPPTVVIQNATGVTVATGGTTGTAGQIKAVLNNVAQGQYYVRVTSQPVLSYYALTIDGRRTQ